MWTWNTKQIFVYVYVEYVTKSYVCYHHFFLINIFNHESKKHNRVVIWDDIIRNKEDAYIKLENIPSEYDIVEKEDDIANQKFNVTLAWDVMPIAGILNIETSSNITSSVFPSKPFSLQRDPTADKRVIYIPMKVPY